MHITLHDSSVCMRASLYLHVIHDERLIVRSLLFPRSVFLRVSLRCSPLFLLSYLYSDLHPFIHVDSAEGNTRCAFAQ